MLQSYYIIVYVKMSNQNDVKKSKNDSLFFVFFLKNRAETAYKNKLKQ